MMRVSPYEKWARSYDRWPRAVKRTGRCRVVEKSSPRRRAATQRCYVDDGTWKEDTMADRELVEWLVYVTIGFGALIVHSVLTAWR